MKRARAQKKRRKLVRVTRGKAGRPDEGDEAGKGDGEGGGAAGGDAMPKALAFLK